MKLYHNELINIIKKIAPHLDIQTIKSIISLVKLDFIKKMNEDENNNNNDEVID